MTYRVWRNSTEVNNGDNKSGITYILMNDLDLKNSGNWTPIGKLDSTFRGTFDGNGHVISNLTIEKSTTDYQGLFWYTIDATIQNMGLENCSVSGGFSVGALVGALDGYSGSSTIENCYATGAVSGNSSIGGLVGTAIMLSIKNCYATGAVSADVSGAGGLVGHTNALTIQDSLALNSKVTSIDE